MSAFSRETVLQGLYDRVTAGLGASVVFKARRYLDFDEISKDAHPAVLVVGTRDVLERAPSGRPAKHHLSALIILYVRDDDPTDQPETLLFSLISQVEASLVFKPGDTFTPEAYASEAATLVNGLVRYVWIRDIEIHHGAGGGQAAATIAVDMLAVES